MLGGPSPSRPDHARHRLPHATRASPHARPRTIPRIRKADVAGSSRPSSTPRVPASRGYAGFVSLAFALANLQLCPWTPRADCTTVDGPGAAVGGRDRFAPARRRAMPRAYSTDLRERALAAYEAGEGRRSEVARAYRIGERTLSGWLKLARE